VQANTFLAQLLAAIQSGVADAMQVAYSLIGRRAVQCAWCSWRRAVLRMRRGRAAIAALR
jgi:hypothetical protein